MNGETVRERASLHPQTVTDVSKAPPTRRRAGEVRPRTSRVTTRSKYAPPANVLPAAWAIALRAADHDVDRIEVVDFTTCLIHNTGDWS